MARQQRLSLLRQMKYFKMYCGQDVQDLARERETAPVRAGSQKDRAPVPDQAHVFVDVGALCAEVRYTPAIVVDPQTTYQVDDFREIQERQRANVQGARHGVVPGARAAAALERVIKRTGPGSGVHEDDGDETTPIDAMVSKTKSLVAMKRERQRRARLLTVEESQMLPNLVRLADLMLTEALVADGAKLHGRPASRPRHPDPEE